MDLTPKFLVRGAKFPMLPPIFPQWEQHRFSPDGPTWTPTWGDFWGLLGTRKTVGGCHKPPGSVLKLAMVWRTPAIMLIKNYHTVIV